MKSGTTSLYSYLTQHPEVAACAREKEPNFFADEAKYSHGVDFYLSMWNFDANRHRVALEATTEYTKYPSRENAAARMADCDLDFRFIYVMRHPVARVRSHIQHGLYGRWIDPGTRVREALEKHPEILHTSRYASQLDEYRSRFGRELLHLVTLEELEEDPITSLSEIADFLGIDAGFDNYDLGERHNSTAGRLNDPIWMHALRRAEPVRTLLRWLIGEKTRYRVRALLAKFTQDVERFEMTDNEKTYVLDVLAPELERLRDEYDVSVDRWDIEL